MKVNIIKEFSGGSMAKTLLVEKNGVKAVRKVASMKDDLGASKLEAQWNWLFNFGADNSNMLPYVGFFVSTSELAYYDMEYIEMETFKDLLINNEVDSSELVLDKILWAGSKIAKPLQIDVPQDNSYIVEKHLNKMVERCKDLERFDFYNVDTININGKSYKNLHVLIKEIKQDNLLLELLRPKCWFRSHGDFTFQNILTDGSDVKVIDPRGEGPDSIYYDISKLLQSTYAKYDLLYEGNYSAWTDGRTDTINYKINENVEKFDSIYEELRELIPYYYELDDEYWELIAKFFCASHMISMTPFRLKENGAITAICYAVGIEILNEVLGEWNNIESSLQK